MRTLRISLLGEMQVDYQGGGGTIQLAPRLQLLLAYLVAQRHKCHPRLSLIDLFWADYAEEQAQKCLRTALWRLRQALRPGGKGPDSYLRSTPTHDVRFNRGLPYWLDVEQFEEGLSSCNGRLLTEPGAAQMEQTLDLYTGDFLDGYYEDWIIVERERLENLYINGLVYLMRHYRVAQAFDKGLACGLKILRVDQLREEAHREIMRIYARTGRRAQAVRQYKECAQILEKELNIEPMPETRRLFREIKEGTALTVSDPAGAPAAGAPAGERHQRLQTAMGQLEQAVRHLQEATALLYEEARERS